MLHTKFKQNGFTLVELMVAIALGVVLTAAIIQSYLGTKQTFRLNDGIARVQENARFSFFFLSKDVRNAGHPSCLSRIRNRLNGDADDFVSFRSSVVGWNATDTEGGDSFSLTGATAGTWSGVTAALPSYLADEVIEGSDVLSFKTFQDLNVSLASGGSTAVEELTTTTAHGIDQGSILVAGNCWEADLFQNTSSNANELAGLDSGSELPGNRALNSLPKWQDNYGPEHNVYGLLRTIYYIGEGASGLPSLFRFESFAGTIPTITSANSQELVEGVESMQILYGEDTDDDLYPNRYVSASEVVEFDNIVSIRVGLLLRSTNNATDINQTDSFTLLDNITITPSGDDKFLRYAVNTTIQLRNLGLNQDISNYVCDATSDSDDTPECT